MIKKNIQAFTTSLDEVKAQLNIEADYKAEDEYFYTLINTATKFIQNKIAADYEITECSLELRGLTGADLKIANANFISLSSVLVDGVAVDDLTVFDPTESFSYFTLSNIPACDKLKLIWLAGYSDKPDDLKHAIIMKAASLYDGERADIVIGTISSKLGVIDDLVAPYKRKYY